MTKTCTSTQNEIIRYIFNETSDSENVFIENRIIKDDNLLNFYLECLEIREDLNKIELQPKEKSIINILEYSKNFKPTIFS